MDEGTGIVVGFQRFYWTFSSAKNLPAVGNCGSQQLIR